MRIDGTATMTVTVRPLRSDGRNCVTEEKTAKYSPARKVSGTRMAIGLRDITTLANGRDPAGPEESRPDRDALSAEIRYTEYRSLVSSHAMGFVDCNVVRTSDETAHILIEPVDKGLICLAEGEGTVINC